MKETGRGATAATTWIFREDESALEIRRRRVAAPPPGGAGDPEETSRGAAAAGSWTFGGDESWRHHGRELEVQRR